LQRHAPKIINLRNEAAIDSSVESILSVLEQRISYMAHWRLYTSRDAANRKLLLDPSTSEAQQRRTED